ncbi:Probable NAD(P)H-dependent D-xylose reductase xyl1 [Seminavis robusta]|uniref:Probable NAD(P)H-dependent D-xylose reductase xyl1 n=1 Tax=Seminavis robusta TaxID=568900 RepID=A0A9N8HMR4_9STRA|nr:Probable NAD(P)H-dependent D-xylose reductase xyl1 [Seminavis robusta]|eukprot:Sro925_g220900.1 Probable NAD(P)H-dependent D-xylose reductase xyl1 (470) ;mRNA; f:28331-29740
MRRRSFLSVALVVCGLVPGIQEVSCQFWSRGAKDVEKGDAEGGSQKGVKGEGKPKSSSRDHPEVKLSNGNMMPLVGLGVGNLQHYMVPLMVAGAIQDDKKTRLFDTSHISDNEHLVAEGINQGIERVLGQDRIVTIHVVTKVWYTYLGYERTKISIRESFESLKEAMDNPRVDVKVHILLHWPRCYENISWMSCSEDETRMPDHVRSAGPPPHEDKDNAWKGSWKALEEAYLSDEYSIESIGVANFHLKDMKEIKESATVQPHILQINVWSLLYDPLLMDYCHKHGVHVQVYNVLNGILTDPERAPNAYHHLQKIASDFSEENIEEITPAQVVLAWLVQHGVSIVPRTSRLSRLQENSALALSSVPALSDSQVELVAHSVEAFLSGDDLEEDIHVKVTFHATTKDTFLYWNRHDGGEVRVAFIKQGESFNEMTYPNHSFRLYDARNKDHFIEYRVAAKFGEHEHVHAEL